MKSSPVSRRKRIFGYKFVAMSSIAIAVFGFLVWAHHMFVAGISLYAALMFSILELSGGGSFRHQSFQLDRDACTKVRFRLPRPMLYAFGFIGLFTMGGLTGLFLAALGIDVHVHRHVLRDRPLPLHHGGRRGDGVSWRHCISGGRRLPDACIRKAGGNCAALFVFIGFNLTFFPQFILGYLGMPRRYWQYPPEFQVLNVLSTAGATILAVGYLLPMIYLLWSLRYGKIADDNPWGAAGLEWKTHLRRHRHLTSTKLPK